jgi:hypothetical protein
LTTSVDGLVMTTPVMKGGLVTMEVKVLMLV